MDKISRIADAFYSGQVSREDVNELSVDLNELLIDLDVSLPHEDRMRIAKKRHSLSYYLQASDGLAGVYHASQQLRSALDSYLNGEVDESGLRDVHAEFTPPGVRLVQLYRQWNLLKREARLAVKNEGIHEANVNKIRERILRILHPDNDLGLGDYARLFYSKVLVKKPISEEIFAVENAVRSATSTKELLSLMSRAERGFNVLGSKLIASEYPDMSIRYPILPLSPDPLEVYKPFGEHSARQMTASFKTRVSDKLFPDHPQFVAIGVMLVNGPANGVEISSGYDGENFYTDSLLVTTQGRPKLAYFDRYKRSLSLPSQWQVLGSLSAVEEGTIARYPRTGRPIWSLKRSSTGMPAINSREYFDSDGNLRLEIRVPFKQVDPKLASLIGYKSYFV